MTPLTPELAQPLSRFLRAVATQHQRWRDEPPPTPQPAPPPQQASLTGIAAALAPFARYVVHKRHERAGDFYVGRPTLWGNPFRPTNLHDDDQREACVRTYARHDVHNPAQDVIQSTTTVAGQQPNGCSNQRLNGDAPDAAPSRAPSSLPS